MSTPAVGQSTSGSPLSITGLASGLDTTSIINALMAVEREPVVRMTAQQEKLQAGQIQLEGVRSSLRQLAFAVAEFRLSSLFEAAQSVTSSDPTKIGATSTGGAGVGGYEVEVKQLANSAQRTFTFASPAAADTITIDGHEYTLKAGGSAKELASKINADSSATVYAAVVGTEQIVLSNRATGTTGGEFIKVTDGGGTLTETGVAKEGKDAEYLVDGVAGASASNTLTGAIAGVTLTLTGLTPGGPVTIVVQPPGANVSAIETRLQEFAKLYNSTVEAIEKQLTTKPLANPGNATEAAVGMLFGDSELSGLLEPHAPEHVRTDQRPARGNVEPARHRHQHGRGLPAGAPPRAPCRACSSSTPPSSPAPCRRTRRAQRRCSCSGPRASKARSTGSSKRAPRWKRGSPATAPRSAS